MDRLGLLSPVLHKFTSAFCSHLIKRRPQVRRLNQNIKILAIRRIVGKKNTNSIIMILRILPSYLEDVNICTWGFESHDSNYSKRNFHYPNITLLYNPYITLHKPI